jgi:menaquinone-dependent protoporphyrinogen IX oxidase
METGKVAVVYQSKSGSTRKYAEWIAEETGADLIEAKNCASAALDSYETIIYGGGLYAVGINGMRRMRENFEKWKGKRLAVFAVGASPVRDETVKEVARKNLGPELLESVRFFLLRGAFDYEKCTFVDKLLMGMLKIRLETVKDPSADQIGMLNCYKKPADWTRREAVAPIVEFARG